MPRETSMSKRIHLIERESLFIKIEGHVHESGYWGVGDETAQSLVGGDIYFHKKQKEESFFGGKIVGFRVHQDDDERHGRIIFRFEFSSAHRGVLAGNGGWSNAMKIV